MPKSGAMPVMDEAALPDAASSDASSFAALIAALAAPVSSGHAGTGNHGRAPAWHDDDLAQDMATLSYEGALRLRALGQSANAPDSRIACLGEAASRCETAEAAGSQTGEEAAVDGQHKSARVTLRLSDAEDAQLRKRAAEAGLTVSGYLRSCTFEAEALRAQVKEALAELRAGPMRQERSDRRSGKRSAVNPAAPTPRRWWHLRPRGDARPAQI